MCEEATTGFGFTFDWSRKWHKFFLLVYKKAYIVAMKTKAIAKLLSISIFENSSIIQLFTKSVYKSLKG